MLSQIDQVQDMWGDYSKGQEEGTHHQIQRLPEVDRDDSNRQRGRGESLLRPRSGSEHVVPR